MKAEDLPLIGKTLAEAKKTCAVYGFHTHLSELNGNFFPSSGEYDPTRVNLFVSHNLVYEFNVA